MGIVVCIGMLFGLCVLQPSPWNSAKRVNHDPKFVLFTAVTLLILGAWNLVYGYLYISGFWLWASIISGLAMMAASFYVFSERDLGSNIEVHFDHGSNIERSDNESSDINNTGLRRGVTAILALSFLVYAVTLIQLNLGYPILS